MSKVTRDTKNLNLVLESCLKVVLKARSRWVVNNLVISSYGNFPRILTSLVFMNIVLFDLQRLKMEKCTKMKKKHNFKGKNIDLKKGLKVLVQNISKDIPLKRLIRKLLIRKITVICFLKSRKVI